jgi:hypothetical protein
VDRQMGPSPRGGAYTYGWIENLLGLIIHSADCILPDGEHPQVGDGFGSLDLVFRPPAVLDRPASSAAGIAWAAEHSTFTGPIGILVLVAAMGWPSTASTRGSLFD